MGTPAFKKDRHALSTLEQRESAFSAAASRALGGPSWLQRRREQAISSFADAPFPTGDEEIWRYSRIGELDLERFSPLPLPLPLPLLLPVSGESLPEQMPEQMPELPAAAHALIDRIGERAGLVISVDGAVHRADLGEEADRAGARLARLSTHPAAEELLGAVQAAFSGADASDAVDDLAMAFSTDSVVLTVPRGVEISNPVVIVNLLAMANADEDRGPALFPRTIVHLAENSSATVIELLVSGSGATLVCPAVELTVADSARLSYSVVQQLGAKTWHLGHSWARAGRASTVRCFTASLGGEYARARLDSLLDGAGGSAELLAAYLGDEHQVHDFRTLQEHSAPKTTSDLVFKGAVGGTARSVYSGMIRMRHGARGANAFQTNRNLVLSDGAHADSVPNLDIQENDVRCSHASAVGPIDAEQRFYLESRGIPRRAATRLILLGFFQELLERADPSVRDHVVASIRGRLDAMTDEASS